mgnify:CR=1 FL=1
MDKKLQQYIEEGKKAIIEAKSAEELLDSIAESIEAHTAEDERPFPKAEAKALIKNKWKIQYEEGAYEKAREKQEAMHNIIDELKGE